MNSKHQFEISFIIPVFNGEQTIIRCLDSIYGIGLEEGRFEVIVVDDCSTDRTLQLLEDYSITHQNLVILHQAVNLKPGGARNRGISCAKGTYIQFCDADDTIERGIISIIDYAQNANLDMCHFHIAVDYSMKELNIPEKKVMDGKDFADRYYRMASDTGYFYSYLYATEFLHKVNRPFIEGRVHEDADWCEYHLWNAFRIAHVDSYLYSHYENPMSIMHTYNAKKEADSIMMCYRRLLFSESIDSSSNYFKKEIQSHSKYWINTILSFRHRIIHTVKDINTVFQNLESSAMDKISGMGFQEWDFFPSLCIYHPTAAKCIIALLHPLVTFAKLMMKPVKK